MALLVALILHLQETFDTEVEGYDLDADGSVEVHVRVRPWDN